MPIFSFIDVQISLYEDRLKFIPQDEFFSSNIDLVNRIFYENPHCLFFCFGRSTEVWMCQSDLLLKSIIGAVQPELKIGNFSIAPHSLLHRLGEWILYGLSNKLIKCILSIGFAALLQLRKKTQQKHQISVFSCDSAVLTGWQSDKILLC